MPANHHHNHMMMPLAPELEHAGLLVSLVVELYTMWKYCDSLLYPHHVHE